jgi:uncharacterized protein with HEPN domain
LRDFQVYIEDIIDAFDSIEEYTEELTYERFVKDKKTVDAVVRNFEVIGEASKYIPESFRKNYHSVPWRVNLEVIWKTIKERLPIVKPLLKEALDEMKEKAKQKKQPHKV